MFDCPPGRSALYDPRDEHDACGVGFVVDIKGRKSHAVVEKGLQILLNLLHRGACGCEADTGDGAGVLVQMPDRFLRKVTADLGFILPPAGEYGAGLVFLPRDATERERLRQLIERTVAAAGHVELTGSGLGTRLLSTWSAASLQFTKVMPRDYKRAIATTSAAVEPVVVEAAAIGTKVVACG